jgi:hypothetical protein
MRHTPASREFGHLPPMWERPVPPRMCNRRAGGGAAWAGSTRRPLQRPLTALGSLAVPETRGAEGTWVASVASVASVAGVGAVHSLDADGPMRQRVVPGQTPLAKMEVVKGQGLALLSALLCMLCTKRAALHGGVCMVAKQAKQTRAISAGALGRSPELPRKLPPIPANVPISEHPLGHRSSCMLYWVEQFVSFSRANIEEA